MDKTMKQLMIIVLLLGGIIGSWAQQDKKAKDLLDEVTAKVKSYNNITIEFKYTLNNPKENVNQESKGTVIMQGNLYHLDFMGVTKFYDGKRTYTINPEDEEITIAKTDEKDENSITPSKMLTFFNSGYRYSMDIEQNVKGRKIQYIKLVPTNPKDARKEILLGIDIQTKHIYNLIEVGKNGTRTTLTVNSFKTNQPISKNQFTFDEAKYKGYYINRID